MTQNLLCSSSKIINVVGWGERLGIDFQSIFLPTNTVLKTTNRVHMTIILYSNSTSQQDYDNKYSFNLILPSVALLHQKIIKTKAISINLLWREPLLDMISENYHTHTELMFENREFTKSSLISTTKMCSCSCARVEVKQNAYGCRVP